MSNPMPKGWEIGVAPEVGYRNERAYGDGRGWSITAPIRHGKGAEKRAIRDTDRIRRAAEVLSGGKP